MRGYDLIILETSGIGQSDTEITAHSDIAAYVMTPEYGAATQLEKIDMLDFADIVALNKFDKRGALDALRDVKKQYQRNQDLWDQDSDSMPVFGTIASQFNDPGVNEFYRNLMNLVNAKTDKDFTSLIKETAELSEKVYIIPPKRIRYLSEISEQIRSYNDWSDSQSNEMQKLHSLKISSDLFKKNGDNATAETLDNAYELQQENLDRANLRIIENWSDKVKKYTEPIYSFKVRDKVIKIETHTESISHLQIPKVSMPKYKGWG